MFEIELVTAVLIFILGLLTGVGAMLLANKLGSGSASPSKIKKEMEDYQEQVEAHFEETSKKFKAMANQYQDLYQHMSVGATTLCRPENIAPGLTDQSGASVTPQTERAENPSNPAANATTKKAVKESEPKATTSGPAADKSNADSAKQDANSAQKNANSAQQKTNSENQSKAGEKSSLSQSAKQKSSNPTRTAKRSDAANGKPAGASLSKPSGGKPSGEPSGKPKRKTNGLAKEADS